MAVVNVDFKQKELQPYIWNLKFECMPQDQLHQLKSERLVDGIKRLAMLEVYKKKFADYSVDINQIQSIDDLSKLPFTTKDELREHYPFGLFASPRNKVVELHTSSGTTGKPTVVGYTREDIKLWSEVTARVLAATGVKPGVIIQDAYGYGITTGGQGFQYGAELIGATVLPTSTGNSKRQLMFFEDLGANVILCTPSYALSLSELAEENGVNLQQTNLQAGIFGAEPWSENLRKKIENSWNIKVHDTYGLSEIIGPGVAHECQYKNGLHIYEDHFFPEIIDPITLEPLPMGETGELVITAITKEALPLIRYRTKDLAKLDNAPCQCGRTLIRMSRIAGRSDDALVVNGVNVFPGQIEHIVLSFPELGDIFQILVDRREKVRDFLDVNIEAPQDILLSKEKRQNLFNRLEVETKKIADISINWHLLPTKSIPRSDTKANRVIYKGHGAKPNLGST